MKTLEELEKQFDGGSLIDRSKMLLYDELIQLAELLQKDRNAMKRILSDFAHKNDPVMDSPFKDEVGCKRCKLCGAVGKRNRENISHDPKCPWIRAVVLLREVERK